MLPVLKLCQGVSLGTVVRVVRPWNQLSRSLCCLPAYCHDTTHTRTAFSLSPSRHVHSRAWGLSQHSASHSNKQLSSKCSAQGSPPETPAGKPNVLTLPTLLTLTRVAAIPALIAVWFWSSPASSTTCTAIFLVASITDWLDGYLARKMNASSAFGAFLDPVADKLMVATVLILLSTQPLAAGPWAGNTWLMPVLTLVIVGREITMSALREWAATLGPAAREAVAVNAWGKWKTATQMTALTLLLLTRDGGSSSLMQLAAAAGPPLLIVAAYLTAHSLGVYMKGMWRFMLK
eukprot:jgi/Chrzof1/719/Cz01g26070.t1